MEKERSITVIEFVRPNGVQCVDEDGETLLMPVTRFPYLPMAGEEFTVTDRTVVAKEATELHGGARGGVTPAQSRIRAQVKAAQRAFSAATRATYEATQREHDALVQLRRLRAQLQEVTARPSSNGRCNAVAVTNPRPRGTRRERRASIDLLIQRGLWKPAPLEVDKVSRHHVVRSDILRVPLAQLSFDEARDLWNN
jgi:hypothetical protein